MTGCVLHTVNLRYTSEEIVYTINKARDRVLFIDQDQVPLLKKIYEELDSVEAIVVMGGWEA
jgi:fatty-acyl-CoA synthase